MKLDQAKVSASRVILITGPEEALRRMAMAEVNTITGTGPEDFDFESFLADEKPIVDWLGSASTVPFLAEKRTVLVRHLLRVEPPETLVFKSLPQSARLIFVTDDEMGDDSKQRRLQTLAKNWERAVSSLPDAVIVRCEADKKALTQMVRDAVKELGKQMSVPAANALAEMAGQSYSRAIEEVDKLIVYVGDAAEIRESDVRAVVSPSREFQIYRTIDAIVAGQPAEAIRNLRILIGSVAKAEDTAFRVIFPTLSRQFRLIWQARVCLDARVPPDNPGAAVLEILPEKPNIVSEPSWSRDRSVRAARQIDLNQLGKCFDRLADADARLKGALTGFNAMETLETMILEMIDDIRPVSRV